MPLPLIEIDEIVDRLERHFGADDLSIQQLLMLAERIARRNTNLVAQVLGTFSANGIGLTALVAAT